MAGPSPEADQIIRQSVADQFPPDQFLQQLDQYLQQHPQVKLFKVDNAVFMVSPAGQGGVEFHTFSAHKNPQELIGTYRKFAMALKRSGVKYAITETTDPQMARIGNMTGLPLKITQKPVDEGNGPQPGFEIRADF